MLMQVRSLIRAFYYEETNLDIGVHNQLGETQYLTAQVESIAEARLLALLGGERLDRLQVKVVVQMEVVQVLAMDQQIQHVVALPAHLHIPTQDLTQTRTHCENMQLINRCSGKPCT